MNMSVTPSADSNDVVFGVIEGTIAETDFYSMTWRPSLFFKKRDEAELYADALNRQEDRLRELAYSWHAKAMDVSAESDDERRKMLEAAYTTFAEENGLDQDTRDKLARLLRNDLRANSYRVASFPLMVVNDPAAVATVEAALATASPARLGS